MVFLPINFSVNEYSAIIKQKIRYNNIIDDAVDDALCSVVEVDRGDNLSFNKNQIVENFYHSLYSGFGIADDKGQQDYLKLFIPVIVITDMDGYYLYTKHIVNNSVQILKENWSEKRIFSLEYNGKIINFSFSDNVKVYDQNGDILEGNYHDLRYYFQDIPFFDDKESFESERKNCIIGHLQKDIAYAINQHNILAKRFGIQYNFSLPAVADTEWYRTVDNVSLLTFFQGYPYSGTIKTFNRYVFSGTRIHKAGTFFVKEGSDGRLYYHREDCCHLNNNDKKIIYNSRQECAANGAYPAEDCNP